MFYRSTIKKPLILLSGGTARFISTPLTALHWALPILVSAFWLAGLATPARALDSDKDLQQCRMDTWTPKDGLPPRVIRALTQTPDGYMWLATDAGLVRFDGVAFQLFNSQNTAGMTRDAVTSVLATRAGLVVGTNGGGFGLLQEGRFQRYDVNNQDWSETDALMEDRAGILWAGGNGHYRLSQTQQKTLKSAWLDNDPSQWLNAPVAFAEDKTGRLWDATTYAGLWVRRPSGVFAQVGAKNGLLDVKTGLPSFSLTCLAVGQDDSLWIGTTDKGLCRYAHGRFTTWTTRDGLSSDHIQALCVDRQGTVWIGTASGLDYRRGARFHVFSESDGLPEASVSALLEDREGNLWAGTDSGLTRFANTKLTPLTPPVSGTPTTLNGIAETSPWDVWLATDHGLLRRHHGEFHFYTTRDGLLEDNLKAVCADRDGSLWVVGALGSITHLLITPTGCRILYTFTPKPTQKSIFSSVARDRTGMVFGSCSDITRELARLVAGKFVPISLREIALPGPAGITYRPSRETAQRHLLGFIFGYAVDQKGTLWAATDTGLIMIDGSRLRLFSDGLPAHAHVLSIAPDSDGSLWLGTDKGLAHFRDGRFTIYGRAQGLPDDNLYQVALDSHGSLWIGGNRGIFTLKTQDLADLDAGRRRAVPFTLYDSSDGIRSYPLQETILHDRAGKLWFMGDHSITLVDPDSLHRNLLPPPVVIERVLAGGKEIAANESHAVRLRPGAGSLEVHFTGLSFENPDQVRFRYRLAGFDADWVEAGTRRAAYYTNLAPGHYWFSVQACNNDGVWNETGASFAFDLAPRYDQTLWFRALIGLAALLLAAGLYSGRTRQLRRQNRALETHVSERTAELVQAVNKLQSQEEKLVAQNEELLNVQTELEAQNEELITTHLSLAESNARLEALATTDPLTGLLNHRSMVNALDAELARAARLEHPCAALFLDIDHFKALNDTCGHVAGDAALHEFASILRECLRGNTVGRWGGEEFLILLPETNVERAAEAAEQVRQAVAERLLSVGGGLRLTCSVGVACYPEHGPGRDDLLQAADAAMYAAKRLGRNQVRTADDPAVAALQAEETGASREEEALAGTVAALAALVTARDSYTQDHTEDVGLMAILLAQTLGLSGMEARQIGVAARLHDIGKIAVPEILLHQRDPLEAGEMDQMRQHPVVGAEVFSHVPGLRTLAPLIRSHHERWDGGGYPDGLAGEMIPLGARILAVADAYAAMTSDRPYHSARDGSEALAEIERQAGTQFDPAVVQALEEVLSRVEIGFGGLRETKIDDRRLAA